MAAAGLSRWRAPEWAAPGRAALEWREDGVRGCCVTRGIGFQGFSGSGSFLTSFVSFRKRKGDEVDGLDEVAKKKSKKEKDKEIKLEKALKVSPKLHVSSRR